MKTATLGLIFLGGFASPAYAHTMTWQDGATALFHQLLGVHHLPFTMLVFAIGVAAAWRWRQRAR